MTRLEEEMTAIGELHHVGITVRDLEVSLEWYERVFGVTREFIAHGSGPELSAAVQATGAHRGSDLRPLRTVLVDLATMRQSDWSRFLARSGLEDSAPPSFAEAIEAVADFADPILKGDVTSGRWDPVARRWRPAGGD